MLKFIIQWNAGWGDCYDTVEAKDVDDATRKAYEKWHEDIQNNADYSAEEYTEKAWEDVQ